MHGAPLDLHGQTKCQSRKWVEWVTRVITCPDILTMVEITEVIPSNTTMNETGFSAGSQLKGDRQALMSLEELDVKLRLYFAFRKYGHTDKLFTDLSFVYEGALVKQWFDMQPKSSKSLLSRSQCFKRRFSASNSQPHMNKQKSAAVDSRVIPQSWKQLAECWSWLGSACISRGKSTAPVQNPHSCHFYTSVLSKTARRKNNRSVSEWQYGKNCIYGDKLENELNRPIYLLCIENQY